jgi:hypothetical protein
VKNFTKLTLSALAIAMCFAACTKDNSDQTSAVKITPKNSVSFAKKDTITPQVKKSSPLVAGKDTITPKSVSFSLKDTITPQVKIKSAVAQKDTITPQ